MIEEPPLLTLHARRNHPTEAQLAAFRDVPTGFVCDAMEGMGALDNAIAPLDPAALPVKICGVALTADPGPADILAVTAALTQMRPGDVLVIATGGWMGCASAGDRVAGMARNGGAVGLVTDGPVRDYDGLVDVGLPVFCRGLSPNSPFGKGPGVVGGPVTLGGRRVETGDIVLADRDGVVVVPFARIDGVIAALARVKTLEADLDAKVAGGLKFAPVMADLIESDQTLKI